MKRCLLLCICCLSLTLSGCQSSELLLNKYSELDLLKSSDVLSLVKPDRTDGYSSDLAVVSVSDDQVSADQTDISSKSAFLVNIDHHTPVYYKNVYQELAPASLTKLLTALMVFKYGHLDEEITLTQDMVTVSHPDAQMCGFAAGDRVKILDLLNCMLVYSGNETANALGIYISGNIPDFCALMNEEAAKIGATHTNFVNANGLDEEGHVTCAYDLYLIFNECLKYEPFKNIINQSSYTVNYVNGNGEALSRTFATTNLYFTGDYTPPEGITVLGGKTGTTDQAGTCLILYVADGNGNEYIATVLGSQDKPELYQQMSNLLTMIQKN